MKTGQIKITGKNQITIPAEIVRSMKISKGKFLKWKFKDSQLTITTEQDIRDVMKPYWELNKKVKPLSDEELNNAMRDLAHKIKA